MDEKKRILIVEDDKYIINFISMSLKREGYSYDIAKTVEEALSLFYANRQDMILLDLGLPDGDGMEVLRAVREISFIPVIVVSTRREEAQKILALDAGADDYVTKPFYMGELLARVRARFRNCPHPVKEEQEPVFTSGCLMVDRERHLVLVNEQEVHLTPMEYRLLNLLIDNRGKVLPHNYILNEIWGSAQGVESGNLRVFMAALRRKIEKDPAKPKMILTEVGVGYRFK